MNFDNDFDIKNININPNRTMKIPKNILEKKLTTNFKSDIKKKEKNRNHSYTINEQYPIEAKTPNLERTPYRGLSQEDIEIK